MLIITYRFPPCGGTGVLRMVKYAKYLKRAGITPLVVTARNPSLWLYGPDASLAADIRGVGVSRVRYPDPRRLFKKKGKAGAITRHGFSSRLKKALLFPDIEILWAVFAFLRAALIVILRRPGAVLTTSPPFSCHYAGYWLKKIFGIKWLADFRDLYLDNPHRTVAPSRREEAAEKRIIKAADVVIVLNETMERALKKRYGKDAKIAVIPNGYDPEDFCIDIVPKYDIFTLTYAGNFYGDRTPETLIKAVKAAVSMNGGGPLPFRVVILGGMPLEYEKMIRAEGLEGCFTLAGFKEYGDTVKEIRKSDALFLMIPDVPGSGMVVTNKLFEYVASGAHIFAEIPERGEAAAILEKYSGGYTLIPAGGSEYLAEKILEKAALKKAGSKVFSCARPGFETYSRKALALRLARLAGISLEGEL